MFIDHILTDYLTWPNLEKVKKIEVEKGKPFIVVELVEYVPNSVVVKTIMEKTTGKGKFTSCDAQEVLTEKTIPFDNFVQIIDGEVEIDIDGVPNLLETGKAIIIPAHTPKRIKSNKRFKMISTIIKSGYEWPLRAGITLQGGGHYPIFFKDNLDVFDKIFDPVYHILLREIKILKFQEIHLFYDFNKLCRHSKINKTLPIF